MKKILLLEDDISLVDGLKYSLEKNGFTVDVVNNAASAKLAPEEVGAYDLLLLDVTLPDGTGFEVCEYIRERGSNVPIIFLTAADEEINVIRGLDSGGDDYITKPFKLGELMSRINALLRRAGGVKDKNEMVSGNIKVDLDNCRVTKKGQALELTGAEYRLLGLLIRNAGRTVTRSSILDVLWDGNGNFVDDNTLSVYIRRLREKIEDDPSEPRHLITVRGFGYCWKEVE
ncbi:MAG: response regulator transcription factor [Oscillospiraceae bacterium]|nr:response regulator transcription factor [Oscillospiraceae bacterium]